MNEIFALIASQTPESIDVGAQIAQNGLYGIISVLGLTTVAGWGLSVRLLLSKGKDVLEAERALHARYADIIKNMREEFRQEYKSQHEKNASAWEETSKSLTELRFVLERVSDRMHPPNNGQG